MNVRLNLATKPLESHRRFLAGAGLLALLGGIVFLAMGWHVYSTLRAQEALRRKEQENRAAERFVAQGERQLDQGNSAEARALFEHAARADPSRWDAHAYLAEMLLSSEDLQLAYPHLLKMEEIDPDSVVGNYMMATYWYKKKDFERARACAEKAKWGRPGNSEIRNLLGNVYLGLGRKKDAREEYEAAVWLAPDRAEFRENLTRLEDRMPER